MSEVGKSVKYVGKGKIITIKSQRRIDGKDWVGCLDYL